MTATTIRLSVKGGSDPGIKRPNNEDYFTDQNPHCAPEILAQKGWLYIVADGVGGNEAGEVASRMAVELTRQVYYQDPHPDIRASLIAAIEEANRQIHRQAQSNPAQYGMGTTITAVVLHGAQFYVANVGDSRTYLIRNSTAELLTRDHTWVAEKVAEGLILPTEAATHPQRNIITRSLGHELHVRVDCFGPLPLQAGDHLLLCTDGLSDLVTAAELSAITLEFPPPEAIRRLIALARQRGAPDNVTALIISTAAPQVQRLPAVNLAKTIPWLLGALLLAVTVLGGGLLLLNLAQRPTSTSLPTATLTVTATASPAPTETPLAPTAPALAPEPVEPADNAAFFPNEAVTLRWGYSDLPETWHFQVLLTDAQGQQVILPDEGLTRERAWTLPRNSLPVGTYRWVVRLVERVEGQAEDRGRSAPRSFSVRPYPTATPTATPIPTLTATPTPTAIPPAETPPSERG